MRAYRLTSCSPEGVPQEIEAAGDGDALAAAQERADLEGWPVFVFVLDPSRGMVPLREASPRGKRKRVHA